MNDAEFEGFPTKGLPQETIDRDVQKFDCRDKRKNRLFAVDYFRKNK